MFFDSGKVADIDFITIYGDVESTIIVVFDIGRYVSVCGFCPNVTVDVVAGYFGLTGYGAVASLFFYGNIIEVGKRLQ